MTCESALCRQPTPTRFQRLFGGVKARAAGYQVGDNWYCSVECLADGLRPLLEQKLRPSPPSRPAPSLRPTLGLILHERGCITKEDLSTVLARQRTKGGGRIGDLLMRMGLVRERDITMALSRQFGIPWVNFINGQVDPAVLRQVPAAIVRAYELLPVDVRRAGGQLMVAIIGPPDFGLLFEMGSALGKEVVPLIGDESRIRQLIDHYYPEAQQRSVSPPPTEDPSALAIFLAAEAGRRNAHQVSLERCRRHFWARFHLESDWADLVWEVPPARVAPEADDARAAAAPG